MWGAFLPLLVGHLANGAKMRNEPIAAAHLGVARIFLAARQDQARLDSLEDGRLCVLQYDLHMDEIALIDPEIIEGEMFEERQLLANIMSSADNCSVEMHPCVDASKLNGQSETRQCKDARCVPKLASEIIDNIASLEAQHAENTVQYLKDYYAADEIQNVCICEIESQLAESFEKAQETDFLGELTQQQLLLCLSTGRNASSCNIEGPSQMERGRLIMRRPFLADGLECDGELYDKSMHHPQTICESKLTLIDAGIVTAMCTGNSSNIQKQLVDLREDGWHELLDDASKTSSPGAEGLTYVEDLIPAVAIKVGNTSFGDGNLMRKTMAWGAGIGYHYLHDGAKY